MKLIAAILVAFALGMMAEHGLRIYKTAVRPAPVDMPEVPQFPRQMKGWT